MACVKAAAAGRVSQPRAPWLARVSDLNFQLPARQRTEVAWLSHMHDCPRGDGTRLLDVAFHRPELGDMTKEDQVCATCNAGPVVNDSRACACE